MSNSVQVPEDLQGWYLVDIVGGGQRLGPLTGDMLKIRTMQLPEVWLEPYFEVPPTHTLQIVPLPQEGPIDPRTMRPTVAMNPTPLHGHLFNICLPCNIQGAGLVSGRFLWAGLTHLGDWDAPARKMIRAAILQLIELATPKKEERPREEVREKVR